LFGEQIIMVNKLMGIEKMSFGEAKEEANSMQEKIAKKEAATYPEAEKLVDKEKMDNYFDSIQSVSIPEGSDPRSPEKIIITDVDGETRELDPWQTIKTIGEGENQLEITAGNANHIDNLHLSGNVPGSSFEKGTSLSDVAKLIEEKFNLAEVARSQEEGSGPLMEKKFVGTIDTETEQFETGVATLNEMLDKGVIAPEQMEDFLDNYKDKIEQANFTGNQEEQDKLMDEFNNKEYPIYLKQRFPGAPVTPFFDTDPVQTSEMAIVANGGKLVTTMTGHHREKLPFSPASTFEFIKEKNANEYARLQELFGSDEEIKSKMEEEFRMNSADWLQAGFIEKRQEEAEQQETTGVEVEDRISSEKLVNLSSLETEIKADFSQTLNQINQDKGIELKPRPDGFHLTIIGPTESKVFKEMSVEQLNTLKSINEKIQKGEGVTIEGIGFIDGAEGDNIKKADKEKKTCFLAVNIPELQEFRTSLGLPEKDLHVTLGFEKGDVHMGVTGQNEKGKDILRPISKKADPSLDQYTEMLNKDELRFGPLDGQEKQKKQEKPKKQEKIASYDSELMKSNLDSLSDEIKEVLDIDKLVELASQDNGKEVDGEIKKLGPQLRANMRFVKEALKKSEK